MLSFSFILEPLRKYYKKHLEDYFTIVLGYEGENSLLGILEARGLALSVGVGPIYIVNGTLFAIDFTLTEKGFNNYKDVYEITMKYIAQLQPDPKIYKDLKETNKLEFQFREN